MRCPPHRSGRIGYAKVSWSPPAALLESGRIKADVVLAPFSWFRVGGPADWFFMPKDATELAVLLSDLPSSVPVTALGVGSNVIIRDGGIDGVVIRLAGKYWGTPQLQADGLIRVPAGTLDLHLAKFAAKHGINGLGFFSGIPGTIGGAIRTNAGCYGRELSDVLVAVEGIKHTGETVQIPREALKLTYRHTDFPDDIVITSVLVKGDGVASADDLTAEITHHQARRGETQPIKDKTSGSTFANPIDELTGQKLSAWQLIDAAGCRGLRLGGAQVSEKHCNFLINTGEASATELEALGELVRARVLEQSGVQLRWEVRRIGRLGPS